MTLYYCLGIRLDTNFMERTCKQREHCPYYHEDRLSEYLSQPDKYQELETYNNNPCNYYELWLQNRNSNSQEKSDSSDFLTYEE